MQARFSAFLKYYGAAVLGSDVLFMTIEDSRSVDSIVVPQLRK